MGTPFCGEGTWDPPSWHVKEPLIPVAEKGGGSSPALLPGFSLKQPSAWGAPCTSRRHAPRGAAPFPEPPGRCGLRPGGAGSVSETRWGRVGPRPPPSSAAVTIGFRKALSRPPLRGLEPEVTGPKRGSESAQLNPGGRG